MSRKLAHYTTAQLILIAVAGLYLVTVDRWLQTPPVAELVHRDVPPDTRHDAALADLFPDDAWQRGDCKRLKTSRGMLLFRNWEQTDRNEWKLWPITVIVGRGLEGEDDEPPLVIDSDEGARIEFDRSLDIMSGGAPPIRTGEIRGNVRVWRDGESESDDSLEIVTSNLSINERKVWTTRPIEMRIGEARLRGEDLTLEFAVATARLTPAADPETLLSRMELIYLQELSLPMSDDATLSVECGGRVQYDFTLHQLRLGETVRFTHQPTDGPEDRFECTELELTLRDPMNRALPRDRPGDWVAEATAVGNPAVVRLGEHDCDFVAESIRLDLSTGEIRAGGPAGVQLRYGQVRANLHGLVYSFDPDDPQRLGMIDARGRGTVTADDPRFPLRELRWSEGLLVRNDAPWDGPDREGTLKVWIDGEVDARLTEDGRFRADAVEGDFRLEPEDQADVATTDARTGETPPPGQVAGGRWLPERVTAGGDVRAETGGFDVRTESLQLFFTHLAIPADNARGKTSDPLGGALREPAGSRPDDGASGEPLPQAVLRGDVIAAKLELAGGEIVSRDLSIHGGVEMTSEVVASGVPLDAKMVGSKLRMREGRGESVIDLQGDGAEAPARLELGDGFFSGPRLQVWPVANVVEIADAGELRLPTALLPSGGKPKDGEPNDAQTNDAQTSDAQTSGDEVGPGNEPRTADRWQWLRPPRCRWQTAMTFDGRTARMIGDVRVEASLRDEADQWDVFLTGGVLQFELQRDVRFQEVRTLRQAALHMIRVLAHENESVRVEALRRDGDGTLQARHLLSTPELRYLPSDTGQLIGQGPGWYRAWMRGQIWNDRRKPDRLSAPNPPSDDATITGVHLTFHDSMVGEVAARSLEFNRAVQIGMRPVAGWEEAFDVAQMSSIGTDESTLACQRLRVHAVPDANPARRAWDREPAGPPPWEMIADGGLTFRARNENGLYEAVADEARYSAAKDRFTVTGSASRVAKFRRTTGLGEPGQTFEFDWLILRPADMTLEDWRLRGVRLGGFPDPNRR